MRTVSIFTNNKNQAIRIPRDMEFKGVSELEIIQENDVLVLRPVRQSWSSLSKVAAADVDFLINREDIMAEERIVDGIQ